MLELKEKVFNAALSIAWNGGYPTVNSICNLMNLSGEFDPSHKTIALVEVAEALKTLEAEGRVKSSIYYFPVED